jgi:hypothetical protein
MDTIERVADEGEFFVLRPSVLMPDWPFVTDASAPCRAQRCHAVLNHRRRA